LCAGEPRTRFEAGPPAPKRSAGELLALGTWLLWSP
jgi:hypothetical protein